MNTAPDHDTIPDSRAADLARESAVALARLLKDHPRQEPARVRMDDTDLVLPRHALELLRNILTEMAQGNAVTLMPMHAEVTTQEAANLLNVSRPHLVKLLEEGVIPFTRVGTHRRIRFQDVMAYRAARATESEAALRALADQAQERDRGY
ncbi:helix-turn-helix domain-containing protein [Alloalcanivorax gelatiniphagus]|nr:helix-turn-helix domain-containing protein [Alloalcanivorax gelatiniphagus]